MTQVRRNDLGGFSAICERHGVVASGYDEGKLKSEAESHDRWCKR